MMNLAEIMQAAQNGQAMANMARQFGIPPQQAEAAVQALLPAFSFGLQRTAQTPQGFQGLMGMMLTGQYMKPFEDAMVAFNASARQQGQQAIGMIFTSPQLTKAVAEQASRQTGLDPSVMMQMMPVMAITLMGGLARAMQANPAVAAMTAQFAQAMGGQLPAPPPPPRSPEPPPQPQPDPFPFGTGLLGTLFGQLYQQSAPSQQPSAPAQAAPLPAPAQQQPRTAPQPAQAEILPPQPHVPPEAQDAMAVFAQLFETGRQIQDQQALAVAKLFESFVGQPQHQAPPRR